MFTERMHRPRRQTGVTLVELVAFIVVVSVGVAGLVMVAGSTIRHSADPMIRKQALAIAESLMSEILQQPFTWCDPQDDKVLVATAATGAGGCASAANDQNKGGAAFPSPGTPAPTPAGETRGSTTDPFDNVADYAGYRATGDAITGNAALAAYTAEVRIDRAGGSGAFAALPADAVLRIEVTVTGQGESLTLTGYRVRYAPNDAG